jgi:hypothetical protein
MRSKLLVNGIGPLGAGFLRRALVVLPASLLVSTAQAGEVPCSGSNPVSCTISAGDYDQRTYAVVSGTEGTEDSKNGGNSDSLSVTNNGTFSFSGGSYESFGGLTVQTQGGSATDEGTAGSAGDVTLVNNGAMTATLSSNDDFPLGFMIEASSLGGAGDQHNDNQDSYGGSGGAGGTVSVTNNQDLTANGTTAGLEFYGILAESAGGNGGNQNSGAEGDQKGGDGGGGNTAEITNNGDITMGRFGDSLMGAAVGGGAVAISTGGAGGDYNGAAGSAGSASVTNNGAVEVYWDGKGGSVFGIGALSSGGDGIESKDNSDPGGNGGGGGGASVANTGRIYLDVANDVGELGAASSVGAAMAAESRGGKGGEGPSKDESGGMGGRAGSATANLAYNSSGSWLETNGDSIYGILVESLGGQGGDGRDITALAGTGGGGGFGGDAGAVTVTTDAGTWITTTGAYAAGIVAHSVGGGGGTGGDFQSVLGGQAGNGGNGGNAGTVTVTNASAITTSGDHAYGVLAQSIAGSGGTGGVETGGLVALGGDGAGGGTAGEAIVLNSGDITTDGYSAHGIVIQSIGGGGGAAGSANGSMSVGGDAAGSTKSNGDLIEASNTGTIRTSGAAAIGLVAQSVGGGGGSGGDSYGIAGVGGKGSAGGDGSTVNITALGTIETAGNYAYGVLAQSVGGGGGNGGDVLTISAIESIGIGGSAAGGGSGGVICIDNTGVSCPATNIGAGAPATIATHGDYAIGLTAQSVGGGGGNGGSVQNYSVASFLALQVGGNGGGGGNGDSATIRQNDLALSTSGAHAIGVLAQSVGGGGGNGGDASYADATIGFNAAVIVGGGGGSGGFSSAVTVDLANATIITGAPDGSDPATFAPNDSFGILAQSIGGGGGNGGSSSAKDFLVAAPTFTDTGVSVAFNFQAAVGGNGGNGGDGCRTTNSNDPCTVSVSLTDGTSVTTLGDGSHAVVAQAIGGGGGNGGDSSVLSTTLGDKETVEVTAGVSLGGGVGNLLPNYVGSFSGENGGWGGLVDVTLGDPNGTAISSPPSWEAPPSAIRTYGDYANGVVAQSIGGGGGNAGIGSSNVYSQGGLVSIKASIGLGGVGGAGGSSSLVTVTQNRGHAIQTYGSGSRGVVAQSIGGGGGTSQGGTLYLAGGVEGFDGRLTVGVGMTGGTGGDSGGVTATTAGTIATTGGDADGVLLQAIGGGGGLGGSLGADASSHAILDRIGIFEDNLSRLGDGGAYTMTVDVGGKGGTGGHGGTINLDHIGQIDTRGDWADGIVAQSIGGGGGGGGSSTASGSKVTASIAVSVGGKGGTGGNGGEIDAFFDGDDNHINTAGYSANAVVLQSIGGGGGHGGDGSDKASGTITVGGSFGGTGGPAGDGGAISVRTASWLTAQTAGDDSIGILAQSIGGGGGTGGAGNSTGHAAEAQSYAVAVTVGGKGGVSGDGGTINLTTGTSMNTYGDRAYGIVAQSIGGGGGIGGAGSASNLTSVVLGGQDGAAGNGGSVTLDITEGSSMNTRGDGAHAVVAQSIGGGGGIAGGIGGTASGAPLSFKGHSPGSTGDGDDVSVTVDGNITTSGDYAFGVLAQSIGGGGGFGGNATSASIGSNGNLSSDGQSGDVRVTVNREIQATGEDSIGVFAQSDAGTDTSGNGNINVQVNSSVTGGSGDNGAGVGVSGGASNEVVVGTGASISAASGVAVFYTGDSSLLIVNGGTISGSVKGNIGVEGNAPTSKISTDGTMPTAARFGGSMPISVINQTGGLLTDAKIYEADVVNYGRLVIGDSGGIDATRITGNLTQDTGGILALDADFAGARMDRLTIAGDATLAGMFAVSAESVLPGISLPFLTVGGTLDHSLSAQSALFDYAVTREGNELSVSAESAHFAEPGAELNDDQNNVAGHLQEIWDAGGGSFGTLFGTLGHLADDDAGSYGSALSDMSPGVSGAAAAGSIATTQQHLDLLLSCPMFAAGTSFLTETECGWAQAGGQVLDQKASGGISGFDTTTYSMQAGAQFEVSPDWFVGIAGGYDRSDIRGDDGRVNADGDTLYAGVSLKHEIGPWLLSGAVAGSYGWYDNTRSIRIPGFAGQAEGDPEIYNLSARVRAAYTVAQDPYYVRPLVDLDLIYSHASGYRETGAGALDLLVDDAGQWSFHATPAVEVGTRVEINETTVMRAFAGAGVSFSSVDSWDTSARLASAPAGIGSFDSEVPLADVVGRFTAGLDIAKDNGFSLRVEYNGSFSDTYTSHGGSLRLSHKF